MTCSRIPQAFGASVVAFLMLVLSGSVPAVPDFVSCNAEAVDALDTRGFRPVPNSKDRERAGQAQRGEPTTSDDAQLTGMDRDGARDAGYQAAYRTCMRRRGF